MRADGNPWKVPAAPLITASGAILLVEASHAMPHIAPISSSQAVVLTRFEQFGQGVLERVRPETVVAPLIGARFDILDIAERLHQARYRGRLIALCAPLPDVSVVRSEVLAACPGAAFEMFTLAPGLSSGLGSE